MTRNILSMSLALALLGTLASILSAGDGFRIDTDVFKSGEKVPFNETQTLFHDKLVYDFLITKPVEITIFHSDKGQITLLDVDRRLKTSITTMELMEYILAMKIYSAESKESLFAFAAKPEFERSTQPFTENGVAKTRLTLASPLLTYTAIGIRPKQPEAVGMYREFADSYARLNAARPGNLPPSAREALNRALDEDGLIPIEIQRSITQDVKGKKQTIQVTSKHLVNWGLTGVDRQRMQEADNMSATFQAVPFTEYCLPPNKKPAAGKQARK